jgi:hypothetical protein
MRVGGSPASTNENTLFALVYDVTVASINSGGMADCHGNGPVRVSLPAVLWVMVIPRPFRLEARPVVALLLVIA